MALLLCACQPTYNWRDIGLEGTNVKAQLPCKPDRTQREVTIAQVKRNCLASPTAPSAKSPSPRWR